MHPAAGRESTGHPTSRSGAAFVLSALLLFTSTAAQAAASITMLPASTKPSARRSTGLAIQPMADGSERLWLFSGYMLLSNAGDMFYYDTQLSNWVSATQTNKPANRS